MNGCSESSKRHSGIQASREGKKENRFVTTKDKKNALFIRGLQEQDVLGFLSDEFGELKEVNTWRVSKRVGPKGPTYAIICDSTESALYILKAKGRLKGRPIWITPFKTKTERELDKNRREFMILNDVRVPQTPANVEKKQGLQRSFLYLLRKLQRLG